MNPIYIRIVFLLLFSNGILNAQDCEGVSNTLAPVSKTIKQEKKQKPTELHLSPVPGEDSPFAAAWESYSASAAASSNGNGPLESMASPRYSHSLIPKTDYPERLPEIEEVKIYKEDQKSNALAQEILELHRTICSRHMTPEDWKTYLGDMDGVFTFIRENFAEELCIYVLTALKNLYTSIAESKSSSVLLVCYFGPDSIKLLLDAFPKNSDVLFSPKAKDRIVEIGEELVADIGTKLTSAVKAVSRPSHLTRLQAPTMELVRIHIQQAFVEILRKEQEKVFADIRAVGGKNSENALKAARYLLQEQCGLWIVPVRILPGGQEETDAEELEKMVTAPAAFSTIGPDRRSAQVTMRPRTHEEITNKLINDGIALIDNAQFIIQLFRELNKNLEDPDILAARYEVLQDRLRVMAQQGMSGLTLELRQVVNMYPREKILAGDISGRELGTEEKRAAYAGLPNCAS